MRQKIGGIFGQKANITSLKRGQAKTDFYQSLDKNFNTTNSDEESAANIQS